MSEKVQPPRPFDEIILGRRDRRNMTLEGSHDREKLSDTEFRLLVHLKRARGNRLTRQDIADILYGEPEGDVPLSNTDEVFIHRLKKKLERISKGRFSIEVWEGDGWFLTDTQHPELNYNAESNGDNNAKGRGSNHK